MNTKADQLSERFLAYGARIVQFTGRLAGDFSSRQIAAQLFRSGTSVGANYEEACGAESRADFIHKLQIAYKEIRECMYWLSLIRRAGLTRDGALEELVQETGHIKNIIGKSLVTAKTSLQSRKSSISNLQSSIFNVSP